MKNIYLYGASDDCHEVETDFDYGFESYGNIKINGVLITYTYDGDFGIGVEDSSELKHWKVRAIEANSPRADHGYAYYGQFIHIQVPDDYEVTYKEVEYDD